MSKKVAVATLGVMAPGANVMIDVDGVISERVVKAVTVTKDWLAISFYAAPVNRRPHKSSLADPRPHKRRPVRLRDKNSKGDPGC